MRLVLLSAALAFVLDQLSKNLVIYGMGLAQVRSIDVLPPFVNFRYGENRGINFGLFGGAPDAVRWVLVAFSLAVVIGVVLWVRRHAADPRMTISAGLLIGGALGNVLDRVIYGFVLDFLNMSCCGIDNPFVFNIADVFIFAGAIGLVLFDGRNGRNAA